MTKANAVRLMKDDNMGNLEVQHEKDGERTRCAAIQYGTNKRCGSDGDHELKEADGTIFCGLCWHHMQMLKSEWYIAVGDDLFKPVALRYYRTEKYGT